MPDMNDILEHLPTNVWPGVDKFKNKLLINEINHNHDGRYPEGLQRNVVLITELNNNINKVRTLYEEISGSFVQTMATTTATTGATGSGEQLPAAQEAWKSEA